MGNTRKNKQQQELKELLDYADGETLRAIYAYLAPVELSLTPEQDKELSEQRRDDDGPDAWPYGLLA